MVGFGVVVAAEVIAAVTIGKFRMEGGSKTLKEKGVSGVLLFFPFPLVLLSSYTVPCYLASFRARV